MPTDTEKRKKRINEQIRKSWLSNKGGVCGRQDRIGALAESKSTLEPSISGASLACSGSKDEIEAKSEYSEGMFENDGYQKNLASLDVNSNKRTKKQ